MKALLSISAALFFSIFQSPVAKAASYTFYFDMPAFTETGGSYDSLNGKSTVLALAMDNGGTDPFDEVFAMRDLKGAQVVSIAGTTLTGQAALINGFNNPLDDPSHPLVTTDRTGKAILNVVSPARAAAQFSSVTGIRHDGYQLAFTGPTRYGACTYTISIGGKSGGLCDGGEPFQATGYLGDPLVLPIVVPLPASLPLLAAAISMVGCFRVRARSRS